MPVSPVLSGIHLLKGCSSLFRTTLVPHYSLGQWFGACTSSTNITCELVRNTNSWVYWPTIIEPLGMRPGKLSKWILCILKFKNHCFRRNSSNSKAVRQCAFNQMWFPSSARILGVLHATVCINLCDDFMSATHHLFPWPRSIQHPSTPISIPFLSF